MESQPQNPEFGNNPENFHLYFLMDTFSNTENLKVNKNFEILLF